MAAGVAVSLRGSGEVGDADRRDGAPSVSIGRVPPLHRDPGGARRAGPGATRTASHSDPADTAGRGGTGDDYDRGDGGQRQNRSRVDGGSSLSDGIVVRLCRVRPLAHRAARVEGRDAVGLLDLHQPLRVFADRQGRQVLRAAPEIEVRHLVHTRHRAARGAFLHGAVFAADVVDRVFHQRLGRIAALLRTVVHQAVLADVEIAGAGAASPLVLDAVRDVVLEIVDLGVTALFHGAHGHVDFAFNVAERLQLAFAVVNDPDRGGEPEFDRALAHHQGVPRVLDTAPHHGVDVHVKIRMLGQNHELLVERFEALFRDLVRHDVVDADLQVLEAGSVEAADAVDRQQIAVGDHAGDHAAFADMADDAVEFRVQQRLAAADRDDGGSQI